MLLDVDHFKVISDTFGHSMGDAVPMGIARRLQALMRQHDVVVRWGGEEFVLVLPGTASEGVLVLAERALNAIGSEPVTVDGKPMTVTVSLGRVSYPILPGLPWQDSLKVADLAMQRGRSRAVCLMNVASEAQTELLLNDLAAAEAAGHVALRTIEGAVAPYV